MSKNAPAFQFYPSDFLGGVMLLSDEAVGIYIKLMSALWIKGNQLPSDHAKLAKAAQTTLEALDRVWGELEGHFEEADGFIAHARFTKDIGIRESRRAAGKMGGDAKANGKQSSSKRPSKRLAKAWQKPSKNSEGGSWLLPPEWDTPAIKTALDAWEQMRVDIKKPVKSRERVSRPWAKLFDSAEHFLATIEYCTAQEYRGLNPEYLPERGKKNGKKKSVGEQMLEGSF